MVTTQTQAVAPTATGKMSNSGRNELAVSLDNAAEELKNAWLTTGNFARTIAYGIAAQKMRDALTDGVMTSLLKLKNSKMGYRTDEDARNNQIYSNEVVRDCIIQAATLGLQCTGNQFNIIGGNMYVTKEGFTFLLREMARSGKLKKMNFVFYPAVITESSTQGTRRDGSQYQKIEREGRTKVDVSWEYNNEPGSEQLEFCIRVNAGMSQDAIIGKAERKAKAWLYNHLADQCVSDGELEPTFSEPRKAEGSVVDTSFQEPTALPERKRMPRTSESVSSLESVAPTDGEAVTVNAETAALAVAEPTLETVPGSFERLMNGVKQAGKSLANLRRWMSEHNLSVPMGESRDAFDAWATHILADDNTCRALVEDGMMVAQLV